MTQMKRLAGIDGDDLWPEGHIQPGAIVEQRAGARMPVAVLAFGGRTTAEWVDLLDLDTVEQTITTHPSIDRALLSDLLAEDRALRQHIQPTVTTLEHLASLPIGTVIAAKYGHILERLSDGWYRPAIADSYGDAKETWLPAKVLLSPKSPDPTGDEVR